jgi:hypothetical protein
MTGEDTTVDPDWQDHDDRGDDVTEPVDDVREDDGLDRGDDVDDVSGVESDETGLDDDVQDHVPPPSPEPTGHPRVDDAVARLDELDALPTSEHADVYEDVHRRLHSALTDLDAD